MIPALMEAEAGGLFATFSMAPGTDLAGSKRLKKRQTDRWTPRNSWE